MQVYRIFYVDGSEEQIEDVTAMITGQGILEVHTSNGYDRIVLANVRRWRVTFVDGGEVEDEAVVVT
jgi:hypothetical protein